MLQERVQRQQQLVLQEWCNLERFLQQPRRTYKKINVNSVRMQLLYFSSSHLQFLLGSGDYLYLKIIIT